jgi:L-threonylcarbamoyladenylate synthase
MTRMKLSVSKDEAVAILMRGGVGVMPTDTVYGLVARAVDREAVKRFYALKHREHKPGTVVAASVEQLVELGVPERYVRRVAHLWPAPLSVVLPTGSELDYLHQEVGSLAVRVPDDEGLRQVLEQTGSLVTSSANQPGQPGSTTVAEAEAYFGESVDFYVDGGDLSGRPPSTLVRVTDKGTEVLRQGAVKLSEADLTLTLDS